MRWVPVTERLPPKPAKGVMPEDYVVWMRRWGSTSYEWYLAILSHRGTWEVWEIGEDDYGPGDSISHWLEITPPEPH